MVRKLIFICQATDDRTRLINFKEIQCMQAVSQRLGQFIAGEERVVFLSSSATTALASAIVIAENLSVCFEPVLELHYDERYDPDYENVLDVIGAKADERNADVVVVMTHEEYATRLPRMLVKQEQESILPDIARKGSMTCIDVERSYCFSC